MSNMSEELATVVAIDGNPRLGGVRAAIACSGCHQQSSCGTGTVAKAFPMKAQRLRVALTGDVAVGQQIRLGIPRPASCAVRPWCTCCRSSVCCWAPCSASSGWCRLSAGEGDHPLLSAGRRHRILLVRYFF